MRTDRRTNGHEVDSRFSQFLQPRLSAFYMKRTKRNAFNNNNNNNNTADPRGSAV
jgi:hypothetical protein